MGKILMGVFSGVFIGAVVYELINRTDPQLIKKVEAFACSKMDTVCGVSSYTAADNVQPSA